MEIYRTLQSQQSAPPLPPPTRPRRSPPTRQPGDKPASVVAAKPAPQGTGTRKDPQLPIRLGAGLTLPAAGRPLPAEGTRCVLAGLRPRRKHVAQQDGRRRRCRPRWKAQFPYSSSLRPLDRRRRWRRPWVPSRRLLAVVAPSLSAGPPPPSLLLDRSLGRRLGPVEDGEEVVDALAHPHVHESL